MKGCCTKSSEQRNYAWGVWIDKNTQTFLIIPELISYYESKWAFRVERQRFFDIISHVSTAAVNLINPLWIDREVSNDVAVIIQSLTSGKTEDFGVDNQPEGASMSWSDNECLQTEFRFCGKWWKGHEHLAWRVRSEIEGWNFLRSQPDIRRTPDQDIQDDRSRKSAVEADSDLSFWKRRAWSCKDAREDDDRFMVALRIAGVKERVEKIFLILFVEL